MADWGPDGATLAVIRVDGPRPLDFPIGKTLHEGQPGISHPRVSPKGDRVRLRRGLQADGGRSVGKGDHSRGYGDVHRERGLVPPQATRSDSRNGGRFAR